MGRYNVGLVCDWFLPSVGGVELQIFGLARHLIAHGHRACVITSTPGPHQIDEVPVTRLPLQRFQRFGIARDWRAESLMDSAVANQGLDVLHCHGMFSPLAHVGVHAGKKHGIATVLTNHSLAHGTPSERAYLFLFPYLMQFYAAAFFGRLVPRRLMRPDLITGVSQAVRSQTALAYRTAAGPASVDVLPNGVDPDEWSIRSSTDGARGARGRSSARSEVPSDAQPRITCVSRLFPSKRVAELVRALPAIRAALPEHRRPILTLIGDGPERPRIAALAQRLGIREQVELLGYQPQPRIRDLFGKTDLFVLPCRREAFGVAALEARTSGLPVVAMAGGGVGEIVEDGVQGFLVENHRQLVDRICQLLANDTLRARFAERATPLAAYTWEAVIARHVAAYQRARANAGLDQDGTRSMEAAAGASVH